MTVTSIYNHPVDFPRNKDFSICVNGKPIEVLVCDRGPFAICAVSGGSADIEIRHLSPISGPVTVHPLSLGIPVDVDAEGVVRFTLPQPRSFLARVPGHGDLYLFIHGAEEQIPEDPSILRVKSGQVLEAAMFDLANHSGIHIEGGGVLRGRVMVRNKPGLRISGHGIFDGGFYHSGKDGFVPSIAIDRCEGAVIEDITMVNPAGWMILLGASDHSTVRRVNQLGKTLSSDGVDIVGSSQVLVEGCFTCNNDDCVAVKAFDVGANNLASTRVDGRRNVENVLVRDCVFWNQPAGHAMDIGHELSVDFVRGIRFENIDVLNVHGHGAVISIHNYGRALVEDVTFENIRIEHCYDKLIDIRISRSRFSTDVERGRIRKVRIRDVDWKQASCDVGYTVSLVGGWDEEHRVEDVTIENFRIHGVPIQSIEELEIFQRHADPVRLVGT